MTQKKILIPFEKYERLMKLAVRASRGEETKMDNNPIQPTVELELQYGEGEEEQLREEDILSSIPKVQRSRVKAVLIHIRNSKILRWNERGEIIYKNQLIPHSHIIDLLKDSQRQYKNFNPTGLKEFYSALEESNVPKALISNLNRREKKIIDPHYTYSLTPLTSTPKKWITL